jgi:hypothetical protein
MASKGVTGLAECRFIDRFPADLILKIGIELATGLAAAA